MVLEFLDQRSAGLESCGRHNEGFDDQTAIRVGCTDHCSLGYGRVQHQRIFDLGCRNVVATRHDHVIGT